MRKPKNVSSLDNQVRSRRQTMGLSQQVFATRCGCTLQAVNAIEGGLYVPSTLIALQLAKVLGCMVEDLFRLPEEYPHIEAEFVGEISVPEGRKTRLQVALVGERVLAHPLTGAMAAFTAADGLFLAATAAPTRRVEVELLVDA
jgi:putative molybdopterin biosynthesis protein